MTFRNTLRTAALVCGLALLLWAAAPTPGSAQVFPPSPVPEQLGQDELDLAARASVVQGSGARALGMAGAFLARADDATAASWNPAGLSYLRLPEVTFVFGASRLETRERGHGLTQLPPEQGGGFPLHENDDNRRGRTPEFFAATFPFRIGSVGTVAQISYQRMISFTNDRVIDQLNTGQSSSIESRGGFDVLALGSGFELSRTLRFGLTVNRWLGGYRQDIEKRTGVVRGDIFQEADYTLHGWNVNLGLIWSPRESLNLGAVFKTAFSADVNLTRRRVDYLPARQEKRPNAASNADADLDTTLDFPAAFGLGASWRPRSTLTLSADYTRTRWSRGGIRDFFVLPARVGLAGDAVPFAELPYPSLVELQHDTQQIRAGAEYVLIWHRLKLPLRGGAFLDSQYFREVYGRAPWFKGLSAGPGLIAGPLLLDVAFVYTFADYQDQRENARFSVRVRDHRVYASLIYRHGQGR